MFFIHLGGGGSIQVIFLYVSARKCLLQEKRRGELTLQSL